MTIANECDYFEFFYQYVIPLTGLILGYFYKEIQQVFKSNPMAPSLENTTESFITRSPMGDIDSNFAKSMGFSFQAPLEVK